MKPPTPSTVSPERASPLYGGAPIEARLPIRKGASPVYGGRPKFRNVRTGKYASKKEARRATELRMLEQAGAIHDLREQVRIELIPAQKDALGKCIERGCDYVADFTYYEPSKPGLRTLVVEDCKGMRTPAYVIKRKLLLWVHAIRIREV